MRAFSHKTFIYYKSIYRDRIDSLRTLSAWSCPPAWCSAAAVGARPRGGAWAAALRTRPRYPSRRGLQRQQEQWVAGAQSP